ncbi:MAG: hypothetical protein NTZ56_11305 [Acidobacteria bacterium]|nr:hypothetical protein [Acidobacteriota bacterium]
MVLNKQQLIGSLQNEIRILLHLCSKVQPEMLDYRPTPKQRSTIELLRYLSVMGPVLVPSIKAGEFLMDRWNAGTAAADALDFAGVLKSLESQLAFYEEAVNGFSDEELQGEIEMFGNKFLRGPMLVNMVVAGHAAYRTQLFCYLKSCGREELGTTNLWIGMDAPAAA